MARARWLPALAVFALAGCGSNTNPAAVPVSGTVTVNNLPLAGATVTFIPTDGTPGFGGTGRTNAEGKYTLTGSRDDTPGVCPGKYKVVISKRLMPDGTEVPADDRTPPFESPARESLPAAYSNMQAPTLTATVPAQGGTSDFPLKDPKKKP